jgi:hypothetical protein
MRPSVLRATVRYPIFPIERSYLPNAAWALRRPPQCGTAAVLPVVLITTCLGVFLAQLDTSVVNLALKHIGAELGSSITQLQWVVDGYNLAYAAFLLTGGTLGDIFGRRRLFMIGVALFSEQFRSASMTYLPRCGRLRVR